MILTMEEWETQYKPITNHIVPNASFFNDETGSNGIMFETYGEEYDYVASIGHKEPNRIWTLIDTEDGELIIINHWGFVNRVGYFITEKPYEHPLTIEVEMD